MGNRRKLIYPSLPFPAVKITSDRVKSALFPSLCKGNYPPESSEAHFFNVDSILRYYIHTVVKRNVLIPFPMTHILLKSHWLHETLEPQNLRSIFLQCVLSLTKPQLLSSSQHCGKCHFQTGHAQFRTQVWC